MSVQLSLSIKLDVLARIQSTDGIFDEVDNLANNSEAGEILADGVRQLLIAVHSLPFTIFPKDYAANANSTPTSTPLSADSIIDEEPCEVSATEIDASQTNASEDDDEDPAHEEEVEEEDGEDKDNEDYQDIEHPSEHVYLKDNTGKQHAIEVWEDDTFGDISTAYSRRTKMPVGKFCFKFNGKIFEPGENDILNKNGVVDGSVIEVIPVFLATTWKSRDPPAYVMSRNAMDNYVPAPNFHIALVGQRYDMINFDVRDLMDSMENFTAIRYMSLAEFAELYCNRTGHKQESLCFEMPHFPHDGLTYRVKDHESTTLDEMGVDTGCVIVAKPLSLLT